MARRTMRLNFDRNGPSAPEERWRGGSEPLDPALRSFFEEFFDAGFSRVRLHRGWLARRLANRFLAITFGEHIFFSQRGWKRYEAVRQPAADRGAVERGILLVGHELTHTMQARKLRLPAFLLRYLAQWARTGFDYWKIPFEQEARACEESLEALLRDGPGLPR